MEAKSTTVLVIEPHPMMRESLCTAIAAEPDLAVIQASAADADRFTLTVSSQDDLLFLTQTPDVVLLALGNPGQTDLLVLDELRSKLLDVPILALTSSEVPGQEQAALEHGARAVVSKSASRAELLQALRTITTS